MKTPRRLQLVRMMFSRPTSVGHYASPGLLRSTLILNLVRTHGAFVKLYDLFLTIHIEPIAWGIGSYLSSNLNNLTSRLPPVITPWLLKLQWHNEWSSSSHLGNSAAHSAQINVTVRSPVNRSLLMNSAGNIWSCGLIDNASFRSWDLDDGH